MRRLDIPRWDRLTVSDALQLGPTIGMRHKFMLDWVLHSNTGASEDYHRLGFRRDGIDYKLEFYGDTRQRRREFGIFRRVSGFGQVMTWAAFTWEDTEYGERLKLFPYGPRASADLYFSDYVSRVAPWAEDCVMPLVEVAYLGHKAAGMELVKLPYKLQAEPSDDSNNLAIDYAQEDIGF